MGRNTSDFHGVTYNYKYIPKEESVVGGGSYRDLHEVTAHLDGKEIGYLQYETGKANDGLVFDIEVNQEHRRKGVATGMWKFAKELHAKGITDTDPWHSEDTTAAGYRWAMTTGDPVPERRYDLAEEDEAEGILPGPKDNDWQGREQYMDIFKGFRVRKTTSQRALQAVKDGLPLTHPALSKVQWSEEDLKELANMGIPGAPNNVVDLEEFFKNKNKEN